MHRFELDELERQQTASGRAYLEFLRVPSMSMGVYKLDAGAVDPQKPHGQDEAYYVASGSGMIRVGDEDRPAQPGNVVFVPAGVEHRFHTITEDLTLLVFFAPAES
jgi:mannose-6-phosphate isomerase-like protein (cupin superfamily)